MGRTKALEWREIPRKREYGEMERGRGERSTQSLIWRDTQHKREDTWRGKTKKGPMEKRR